MRCVEMHDWPGVARTRRPTTFCAAASTSALGSMISGALLPSSSPTFLRGARALMPQPTSGEPVNVIERDVGVVDDRVADGATAARHDVEVAGGEAALVEEDAGERERRERSLARGLQHHRAAGRDRGCELVRDEVEREVERADRADDADRHAQRERELAFAGRARVHRAPSRPASVRAATAANVNVEIARCASTRAVLIGLAASVAMTWASSSVRSGHDLGRAVEDLGPLPGRQRARPRARPSRPCTAASTCSGPHAGTRPRSASSYGARTSIHVAGGDGLAADRDGASQSQQPCGRGYDCTRVTKRSPPGGAERASRASRGRRGAGRSRTPR